MRILVRNVVPYALAVLLAVLLLIALALMIWFWRMAASHRPGPLAILTRGLPNARASFDYEVQLACTGGVPPYRWSIATGGVPEGMTLEEDGRLHGRPFEGVALAATKDIPFTVVVRDARGDEARADL
jgi:hypothetical protein